MHIGVLHVLDGNPAHHLHPHRAVDEEDEGDQQHDPGQSLGQNSYMFHYCLFNPVYLEGLHESPKKGSDVFILVQELDQSRHTEESEEGDGHHLPIKRS